MYPALQFYRRSTQTSHGLRKYARAIALFAWGAFWLNAALFPCCQAIAASSGEHDINIVNMVAVDHVLSDCDDDHPGEPGQKSPHLPCSSFASASPAAINQAAPLDTDHDRLQPIATVIVSVLVPPAPDRASRFPAYSTPPPIPLYLRGLNLRL